MDRQPFDTEPMRVRINVLFVPRDEYNCEVIRLFDKQTLQYVVVSTVFITLTLVVSKNMTFNGVFWAALSTAVTGVPKKPFVEIHQDLRLFAQCGADV